MFDDLLVLAEEQGYSLTREDIKELEEFGFNQNIYDFIIYLGFTDKEYDLIFESEMNIIQAMEFIEWRR